MQQQCIRYVLLINVILYVCILILLIIGLTFIYIDPDCDTGVNHEDLSKLTAAEENMKKNDGARNALDCQG